MKITASFVFAQYRPTSSEREGPQGLQQNVRWWTINQIAKDESYELDIHVSFSGCSFTVN